MVIKGLKDEDFVNYKKPSMFIAFPACTWKCDKECGRQACQNSALAHAPNINVSIDELVERYMNNPITKSIVIGGLEPFDNFIDLYQLVRCFRDKCYADVVIYTGYTKDELVSKRVDIKANMSNGDVFKGSSNYYDLMKAFQNIIIKFGRYIPNQEPHYDEVLGVNLASDNQYAERIS